MTALISLEKLPLGRRLTAPRYDAGPGESRIDLQPGERMTVRDLLRALLLESANDAAVTLARGAAPSVHRFVTKMNKRARKFHLVDTHYANPVGLDQSGNYSSALDLSRLSRRLLHDRTFARIVNLPRARLESGSRPRIVDNRNDLVARYSWIDGVKTGHTARAGFVLIGAGRRKGARLVSVVLGAPSELRRDQDTLALLDYGFSLYRRVRVLHAGAVEASPRVALYGDRRTDLIAPRGAAVAVRRGQRARVVVQAPSELKGPIARGKTVGRVAVFLDKKRVRIVPLVTSEQVPKAGLPRRLGHALLRPLPITIILGVTALVALRSRRRRAAAASLQ
jgi:D-alanyl-D-alanine carboxypeptidase (penicillin-binding protein 5/6)